MSQKEKGCCNLYGNVKKEEKCQKNKKNVSIWGRSPPTFLPHSSTGWRAQPIKLLGPCCPKCFDKPSLAPKLIHYL